MNNNSLSSTSDHFWFIVPAAGIGKRMGASSPKQYLPLGDKLVLEHTLEVLLSIDGLAGIVVALNPSDHLWHDLPVSQHEKIHTVTGGIERADSVMAALDYLGEKVTASHWVLVHDAARPCVHRESIYSMIGALKDDAIGGILGVPSSDTLKEIDQQGIIEHTLNREVIWQAQTPQMFRYGILQESLRQALEQGYAITDEASAVEKMGHCVKIISGRQDNIKITRPNDLYMAKAILQYHKIDEYQ